MPKYAEIFLSFSSIKKQYRRFSRINHNIAEKTFKTPKKSNCQDLPSDFSPKLVGFTVQVYP